MFSLINKHAVITGAGSGIGKSIAETFARQGATVHIIELNEAGASETVKAIEQAAVVILVCDAQVDVMSVIRNR